jgi:glycosyltransferase involved in cell wall biosynthesis
MLHMNKPDLPLVSIGIPTYNRATSNLLNVIERALGQTYENIEVIVSDNCSSDHTPELVGAISDPRLRYIRQDSNIGANNNFNYCLSQAKGEYFLLFHDDDMIDEDFIESCIASLNSGLTVGAIFTGVRIIDEHDNVLMEYENLASGLSPSEFIQGWFEGKVSLYLCSSLYHTESLRAVGGFHSPKQLFDDLVPLFSLIAQYGRADVPVIKASFRRHSSNRGSSIPVSDWIEDSHYVLEVIDKFFPDELGLLHQQGTRYFCRKMYAYASARDRFSQRFKDYAQIYRSFGYSYSPLSYHYEKLRNRVVGKARRMLAGAKSEE